MNGNIFYYVKDRYAQINHVTFELKTFHTLFPKFDISPATHVSYDVQTTIFNDGINQWGGDLELGGAILLRFNDLLMMKKNIEETKDS